MRKRLGAVAVVGTAAIAACMGALVGEMRQLVVSCGAGCTTTFTGGGTFDFGPVPVMNSVKQMFQLVPAGPNDDDLIISITPMGTCGPFPITQMDPLGTEVNQTGMCGASTGLQPQGGSGTCTVNAFHFTVTFTPAATGQQACTYQFQTMPKGGGTGSIFDLNLTGTGAASFGVSASPPTIDFGDIPTGTMSTVGYTVTDTGTMGEQITEAVSPVGGLFSTDFMAPTAFFGLETKQFTATCTAGAMAMGAAAQGTLTFTDGHGSSAQVALRCRPITTLIGINPAPISFAPQLVGFGAGSSFTVSNLGSNQTNYTVTLDPATAAVGVVLTGMPINFSLNGGATSAPMSVVYLPADVSAGRLPGSGVRVHASFTVGSGSGSGSGSTDDRNALVLGNAELGTVATSPVVVDFQSTCAGVTSASQLANIYAADTGSFHVTSISAPGQGFAITGGTGLAKGNHANDLVATVTASPPAPGPVTAMATVQTDIPADVGGKNTPTATLVLRANGLPAGVNVDQKSVHFNGVPQGMTSSPMIVTFGNCSPTALTNVTAQLVGADAADFAIGQVAATVASNQSVPIQLTFTPSRVGLLEVATLQITYDGGSATVALDGTGTSTAAGKPDRQTYYACASGRPLGLLPLALALVFVLRRRKK